MEPFNRDLLKRYERVKSDRTTIQDEWNGVSEYIARYAGDFFKDQRDEHTLEWARGHVLDSTAEDAYIDLVANLHGNLTSPSTQWFDVQWRSEVLQKDKAANVWMQNVSDRIYYSLQDSNFNLKITQYYKDLVAFGTACLMLEEGKGDSGLHFTSIPIRECFFEEDAQERVLRLYRAIQWTPAQILSEFGDDVPQSIRDMDTDGNVEKQDVLFAVYPKDNRVVDLGKKVAPSKRPWESRYMLCKSGEPLGKPVGLYEMPVFIGRWDKRNSSVWGESPAMKALPDVLTLNKAIEIDMMAREKLMDPPVFITERAFLSDLDLSARSINVVRDMDGWKTFQTGADILVSNDLIQRLQQTIRKAFYGDKLTFPDPQGTPMSATEASIRNANTQRLLGPMFTRQQNDVFTPVVNRALQMLARNGELPPLPEIVIEAGAEFDIQYLGSLSRAQHQEEILAMERLVVNVGQMAQLNPEVLDMIDFDAIVRELQDSLNAPAQAVRSLQEVEQVREARAEQMAQAQQVQQAQAEGDAMQSVGAGRAAMEAA